MKYPYIGRGRSSGTVVMMVKPECGLIISSKTWATKTGAFETSIDESYIANITHEYLSNTWGVVESKEHAEFIIELAELHGFKTKPYKTSGTGIFMISGGELYFYSSNAMALRNDCKQITIPLPPKAKEWPQVGDDVVTRGGSKGVLLIGKTDKDGMVVCDFDGEYALAYLNELKKPKSNQELLIEELQTKLCNNNAVDNYILACDIINGDIEGLRYESK